MRKIMFGAERFLVFDLTQPLSLETEIYPGDPKPRRETWSDIKQGWHHYVHTISDHSFRPHADAPNHQNIDLQDHGIESYGLEHCFNRAFMIDLTALDGAVDVGGKGLMLEVTKDHLVPYEHLLSDRSAVVIRTGYDVWLEQNLPHDHKYLPFLSSEAAAYLASFENLRVVAIDSITVDPQGVHSAHQALKGKMIVESLPFLHDIPKDAHQDFLLQTSPLRIKGATGSPVIAYAFIKEET